MEVSIYFLATTIVLNICTIIIGIDRFIDKNERFRYTWMQLAIMNIVVLAVIIFLIFNQ